MRHGSERGSVLVPVVLVVLLMATLTLMVQAAAVRSLRDVSFKSEDERLQAVGDAALDLAAAELWNGYRKQVGAEKRTLAGFRDHLTDVGIAPVNPEAPETTDLKALIGTTIFTSGGLYYAGARIHELGVVREDRGTTIALRIRVSLSFAQDKTQQNLRTLERIYFAQGPKFKGFEFGLLANNVNCIMCHAAFDSTERYYNRDPEKYGTFDRIRIGTLESLKIRSGSADSTVAGTLYVRGSFMDKDGSLVKDPSSISITSMRMDGDGKIVQDGSGRTTETDLVAAQGDPLPPLHNLYIDYPMDEGNQTDGDLPSSFPAIIPDRNGDRRVDDDEFEAVAYGSEGTLVSGYKVVVPYDEHYYEDALPTADNAGDLKGTIRGNLILRGTPDNPIEIDGLVTVDGDVVLEGTVKGAGEMIARGNIYVVGPVLYADGEDKNGDRTYGVGADGAANRLVLGAGGNVLMGDFLRSKDAAKDEPIFEAAKDADIAAAEADNADTTSQVIRDYEAAVAWCEELTAALGQAVAGGVAEDIALAQTNLQEGRDWLAVTASRLPEGYLEEPAPDPTQDPDPEPDPTQDPVDDKNKDKDKDKDKTWNENWKVLGNGKWKWKGAEGTAYGLDPTTQPSWVEFDVAHEGASDGTSQSDGNLVESEIVIFNRDEWAKTQPQLPGAKGMVDNPLYIPGYVPRYYVYYEGNPVYIMNGSTAYFDPETKTWIGREHVSGFNSVVEYLPGDPVLKGATIMPLMSHTNWIDDSQLIEMASESSIRNAGSPFEMNAMVYTNNATFFIARSSSPYKGQAIINGGLVGADMGILVPGDGGVGLQLNYDKRVADAVEIREQDRLVLTRGPRLR